MKPSSSTTSSLIRSLRSDFVHLVNSNEYGVTQELFNVIQGIISALDSLKLDTTFMKSPAWRSQADAYAIHQEQSSIHNLLSQGTIMIRELMMSLDKKTLANLQENEIRNAHYVANEKLNSFLKSIHPFSYGAYSRLNDYSMTVKLTDRYANIRNELASKDPPNNLSTFLDWSNKSNPSKVMFTTPDYKDYTYGSSHLTSRYENKASSTNKNEAGFAYTDTSRYLRPSSSMANLGHSSTPEYYDTQRVYVTTPTRMSSDDNDWKKSATEAGIHLGFPGISEQKYRFKKPVKANYLNFVINPSLNIAALGRPFSEAVNEPIGTEYQNRYKAPSTVPFDKFPWIKQV